MSNDKGDATQSTCCGTCRTSAAPSQPRLVIGVFNDPGNANGVAEKLRVRTGSNVNVFSNRKRSPSEGQTDMPALSLMGCGRIYEQVTAQLESGAFIVIVDTQSSEQQLGISRVLLESKCDMLLTHDGSHDGSSPSPAE